MRVLKFIFSIMAINGLFAQSPKAKELVMKMTREEKVSLVTGLGQDIIGFTSSQNLPGQVTNKVPGAAGNTFAIPRLGIPNTVLADGPAGLRIEPTRKNDNNTYYATAWPIATLLASTWDKKLVNEIGKAIGNEVKEYGVDVILGPGVNIHRNPLGGRNFEYYSEDPVIAGEIAAAMINGIQSNGVGTSIKHFAGNNQETDRASSDDLMSERTLREIYLRAFEIAIKKSKPWTIMTSYNLINGTYTSESKELLNTILRKEWGYKGMVMTDWFGGKNATEQMKAGNDLLMPGTKAQQKEILEALKNGKLSEAQLNENAARIVDYILKSPSYNHYKYSNKPDVNAHAELARKASSEGMVLLRNENNTLPLSDSKKVALFGTVSYDFISGGKGSGSVNASHTISMLQGLENSGYTLNEDLKTAYSSFIKDYYVKNPPKNFFQEIVNPSPMLPQPDFILDKINASSDADLAIITFGRQPGEGHDRKVNDDFNLSDAEQKLIDQVSAAFHAKNKKVVVVLNIGGVIETASWRDKVDAILLSWQPGMEGGNAVADVLSGKVNPSGKLASTFPMKYSDEPSAKNFPGKEDKSRPLIGPAGDTSYPAEITYEEGVFVGYRYYDTFNVPVSYPFGFGLSYTQFQVSNLNAMSTFKDKMKVSISVKNTGKTEGKDVVQVFVSVPKGKFDNPKRKLIAFEKTNSLKPGASQEIQFEINAKDLAYFNDKTSSWLVDAGDYVLSVGNPNDHFETKTFNIPKEIVVEKCNKVLTPKIQINELKIK